MKDLQVVHPSEMIRRVQALLDGGLAQASSGELESLLKDVVKELSALNSLFVAPYQVAVECEVCGYGRDENRCIYCCWVSQADSILELLDELKEARGEDWFTQWILPRHKGEEDTR